jgi:uncharacterized integral membrane protein
VEDRNDRSSVVTEGAESPQVDAEAAPGGGRHPAHAAPTRTSASWTAVVAAIVVLIGLVIFIAENTQRTTVSFLGIHGHAPTGVVVLVSAVVGAAIVAIVGTARILQLRRLRNRSAPVGP